MSNILVVDDEKAILQLYEKELLDDGYEVTTVASARHALEHFRSKRPDVVVLDIRMPGMDGLEVMRQMLSIDPHVPMVLNSAYTYHMDDFTSWPADAYISKSSDLSELKRTIKSLLSSRSRPTLEELDVARQKSEVEMSDRIPEVTSLATNEDILSLDVSVREKIALLAHSYWNNALAWARHPKKTHSALNDKRSAR